MSSANVQLYRTYTLSRARGGVQWAWPTAVPVGRVLRVVPPADITAGHNGFHVRWAAAGIGLLAVAALAAGVFSFLRKGPARSLATAVEKSIAVLPFENLSEEKANAFFTEGVQDETLTHLARIADLKVISRTSVMQYKSGAPLNLREIGQQPGVAHVVEGSVQRAANKVRVIAQLTMPGTTRICGPKPTLCVTRLHENGHIPDDMG
jgi:TolB-like protein